MLKSQQIKDCKKINRMLSYKRKSDCRRNLPQPSRILTKSTRKQKGIFKLTSKELNRIRNQHAPKYSKIISSKSILTFLLVSQTHKFKHNQIYLLLWKRTRVRVHRSKKKMKTNLLLSQKRRRKKTLRKLKKQHKKLTKTILIVMLLLRILRIWTMQQAFLMIQGLYQRC